jgi:hypothetical protein
VSPDAIGFFRKAALVFSRGDITKLLAAKLTCAGPLLAVTVNGVDLMGGICFSFTKGSRERSVEYMRTYMNIDPAIATALYVGVRCGVAHQGMPKIGINFFVLDNRYQQGAIIYKGEGGHLWLNVTELAYSFLDSLEFIERDPTKHVKFCPGLSPKDTATYTDAVAVVTKDIQDLCTEIGIQAEAQEHDRFERGKISEIGSPSAYFPDNTLDVTLKVDPIEGDQTET